MSNEFVSQHAPQSQIRTIALNSGNSHRELLQHIDDGFCVIELMFDEEGQAVDYRFVEVNNSFESHTGLQDALGKRMLQLVPNLDGSWARLYGEVALTGKAARFESYAPAMARWFEVSASRFGEAHLRRVAIIFKDTTKRKAAEEERSLAHKRVTEILESMGDSFLALDKDWSITLVNSRHERTSALLRSETLGRKLWDIWPEAADPASKYWTEYHRCRDERVPVRFTEYYAPLNLWSDVRAYPSPDGGITVFFRDISEEKRALSLLKRQADFEKQLIGIVSHDLRNPVSVILLGATALLRGAGLAERQTKNLVRIQAAAERAGRMIRDLLDFTQARLAGGIPIQCQPMNLNEIVQSVVDEVEATHVGREVIFIKAFDGQGQWDADRLSQAVQNLVTNALKYSPQDTPVKLETFGEPDFCKLSVHNYGPAIPENQLLGIFEPLQRGISEIDKSGRSIGLGLYIVKQIVSSHGGTISVDSTRDVGTRFTIRLPRSQI